MINWQSHVTSSNHVTAKLHKDITYIKWHRRGVNIRFFFFLPRYSTKSDFFFRTPYYFHDLNSTQQLKLLHCLCRRSCFCFKANSWFSHPVLPVNDCFTCLFTLCICSLVYLYLTYLTRRLSVYPFIRFNFESHISFSL